MAVLFLSQKQQGHLKTLLDEKTAGFEHTKKRQEQSTLEMQLQTQKDANIVEQLKRIVAEKEEKVRQLEDEIAEMQQNVGFSCFVIRSSHTCILFSSLLQNYFRKTFYVCFIHIICYKLVDLGVVRLYKVRHILNIIKLVM